MINKILLYKFHYPKARIYVCLGEKKWELVDLIENDKIIINNETINLKIKSFLITHKDGQVIDSETDLDFLPKLTYYIEDRIKQDKSDLPMFTEIEFNSKDIKIEHSKSPFSSYDEKLYTTKIINTGNRKVKVNRFTAYNPPVIKLWRKKPKSSLFIGGWFLEEDFRNCYNFFEEWIIPNQSVSDPENFGTSCVWLYECEFEDGTISWVGTRVTAR